MRNLIFFICAVFFAGCSFRPEIPKVDTSFEATYKFETSDINDRWWEEFRDENLNSLITQALQNNINLRLALLNLQKAEASLGVARADLLPSLNLNSSASRAQSSGETYTGQRSVKYSNYTLNLGLNYEVDLWGRVKNSIEAANSTLNATKFDYDTARLSIASSVAKNYFALVSLKMQENILNQTLKAYEDTLKFRKTQLDLGAINNAVYLQSKAAVQSAKVSLTEVQNSISSALTALSVLTGKTNNEILSGAVKSSETLPSEPEINAGISSEILLRRSDVASAFENLKATNALIGVAKADYFPTISLTGLLGFASDELGMLFAGNAATWSIGGNLAQKIFDYGRTKNRVQIAQTNEQISALNYENTVKTALGEVKDALVTRQNARLTLQNTKELLKSQEEIYRLAQNLFDEGYNSHLELLDAQRNLLATKRQVVSANLNLINSAVEVYKAFGGGFKIEK